MNEKEQLIREIEQAPDVLVREVLDFLLFTKNRIKNPKSNSDFGEVEALRDRDLETELKAMAEGREVQEEITAINREFLVAEMDGLTSI